MLSVIMKQIWKDGELKEGDGGRCDQVIAGFVSESCGLKCPPTSCSDIKSFG